MCYPPDLRFVFRSLSRNPVVISAAILSLSLAIGANTALFTITNQVLLRTLPVKDPQRLVLFNWRGQFIGGSSRGLYDSFSYPAYSDLRDGNPGVFTGIAAQYQDTVDISANGPAQRAVAELVSGNYFQVLGVKPAIGRAFTATDDKVKDGEPYAVLSYEFWQRRFGGDLSVLNRVIDIDGHPMTIVGVMQRGFAGFDRISPSDVFVPMMMKAVITPTWDDMARRNSIWLHIFGRLAPGVTPKQAAAAMSVSFHHVLQSDVSATGRHDDFARRYFADTLSFSEAAKGMSSFEKQFAKPLYVLLAMVGTLLLIACANIANLLITRAAARHKEIAIRLSLGATRASLVRLILTESLCIAIFGGMLGLLLSSWLVHVLVGFLPYDNMSNAIQTSPDPSILVFTTAITVLTALFFGLIPALRATRPNVAPTLKNESASVSLGTGQTRLRRVLVCAQVALSLVLLFAAGLFARSLHNLLTVDSGMNVSHIVQFSIDPSLHKYTPQRSRQLFVDLQDRIRHLPGVVSASAVSVPVLAEDNWQNTVHVEGYRSREGEDMNPGFNRLLPGFFTTLGAPLIAGRDFSERDTAGAPQVAIVNETFVKRFVPNGRAIGLHFGLGGGGPTPYEIVGVVRNVKDGDLKEEAKPYTYMSALQDEKPSSMTYYVRTMHNPKAIAQSIRQMLRSLDTSLPIYDLKTLENQIDQTQFIDRLFAWLSSAFGILATLLAAIGLYGITSYSVARRTHEIGIRVALGAEQRNVFQLIMREVLLLTIVGIAAGAPLVFWVAKIASGEVFGIKSNDPFLITTAILVIIAVSALAGFIPARRAMRVDPIRALRYE
ncbi:MAG: ABC transporter permease [Acidobacteriota bacterium]|nr:ABC transporter permease [Acidobacteriota bacterium]